MGVPRPKAVVHILGVPKWFLWAVSVIAGFVLPWVIWVSHTLVVHDVRLDVEMRNTDNSGPRLGNVEQKVIENAAELHDLREHLQRMERGDERARIIKELQKTP